MLSPTQGSHPAIQFALLALQAAQVAFLLLHDYVPLGRLTNLEAVRASDSPQKLLWTSLLSTLPFALVFAVCCRYGIASRWPMWLQTWLCYTYGGAAVGAILAWWLPYLGPPNPERAARYRVRFAGTMRFLPERNGIAPDTVHVLFHCCIVATLVLMATL